MFYTTLTLTFIDISASKTTLSHYNLKILRPKVTKNCKNLRIPTQVGIFWQMKIDRKAAHKMLVKLTTGIHFAKAAFSNKSVF